MIDHWSPKLRQRAGGIADPTLAVLVNVNRLLDTLPDRLTLGRAGRGIAADSFVGHSQYTDAMSRSYVMTPAEPASLLI